MRIAGGRLCHEGGRATALRRRQHRARQAGSQVTGAGAGAGGNRPVDHGDDGDRGGQAEAEGGRAPPEAERIPEPAPCLRERRHGCGTQGGGRQAARDASTRCHRAAGGATDATIVASGASRSSQAVMAALRALSWSARRITSLALRAFEHTEHIFRGQQIAIVLGAAHDSRQRLRLASERRIQDLIVPSGVPVFSASSLWDQAVGIGLHQQRAAGRAPTRPGI